MAAREIAVKKYVVKLTEEERERLDTLIRSGKHSAQKLTKARILLKADASEAGEAWRVTAGSLRPWTPASRRSPEPDSNWLKKGSMPS